MNIPSEYTIALEQFDRMSLALLPLDGLARQAAKFEVLWAKILAEYVVMVCTDDMWTPAELDEFRGVVLAIGHAFGEVKIECNRRGVL